MFYPILPFCQAKLRKSRHELCSLEIFLDQLRDVDFHPLLDVFSAIDSSEIDAVDMLHESSRVLFNGEHVASLIRAVSQKLRVVDLQDLSCGKSFFRDLSQRGFMCQVLNLRSSHIRKLNMTGNFLQLQTLNLDFSSSLTGFQEGCFSCMPNLMRLSLCETRISNLWTTSAALSKLPSLQELRFQNCLCCNNTGPCPTSSCEKSNSFAYRETGFGLLYPPGGPPSSLRDDFIFQNIQYSGTEETFNELFSTAMLLDNLEVLQSTTDESSDESELDFSSHHQVAGNWVEILSNTIPELTGQDDPENLVNTFGPTISFSTNSPILMPFQFPEEVSISKIDSPRIPHDTHESTLFDDLNSTVSTGDEEGCSTNDLNVRPTVASSDGCRKTYISYHPSPICFEKHYREYMIALLPHLKVLDNLLVQNADREKAKIIFSQHYEYLPHNIQCKESVVSILRKREIGTSTGLQKPPKLKQSTYSSVKSQYSFSRSLSAAKVGSSPWPLLYPVSKARSNSGEYIKRFRPRQFEYHPSDPSLMVFGTLDGELVVINHESGKLVGYLQSVGALHSVLGLCWLKKYPSKLIAGSDNGSLQLYNICQMASTVPDRYCSTDAAMFMFDEFEHLTSVHVNSTDELFLASGYSKHVALYDIGSGRCLNVFKDLHREHINVVKFAHHSPSIFATSSFDQEVKMWDLRQGPSRPCYAASSLRGNVMVCFSPDDYYLLSSAVDNEVKQLLAVDGRLHMKFNIASTGSAQNYTRSYYMNGRDYIISGSCEENVVRICCAQTGRRLRDISLEGRGSRSSMFVQSLRGDPFRDFHMSVLAAYLRPSSKSEIIKVNLLSSGDYTQENSNSQHCHPLYGDRSDSAK
ncbi:transducin family protein / WD-40 repeat family protein isoform X2 [Tasmannia lanceolata]|uniref:transducin family protein / WD-40 repeat family protein isoform X2 n=1 Tax=Tasmannia lanceolata TaxID=3420 RepID=UPI004063295C